MSTKSATTPATRAVASLIAARTVALIAGVAIWQLADFLNEPARNVTLTDFTPAVSEATTAIMQLINLIDNDTEALTNLPTNRAGLKIGTAKIALARGIARTYATRSTPTPAEIADHVTPSAAAIFTTAEQYRDRRDRVNDRAATRQRRAAATRSRLTTHR